MLVVNFMPALPPSVNLWQVQINPDLGKPHHQGERMGSLYLGKMGGFRAPYSLPKEQVLFRVKQGVCHPLSQIKLLHFKFIDL